MTERNAKQTHSCIYALLATEAISLGFSITMGVIQAWLLAVFFLAPFFAAVLFVRRLQKRLLSDRTPYNDAMNRWSGG